MKTLKLGIIGLSEGNGHPYSWSAIFNGYNAKFMEKCPFPSIPKYLSNQNFPKDAIQNAKVTHIWTQKKSLSEQIAKASNIENIVTHYEDLIGKVDAILLARDDSENHYKISKPLINAKLPIYIDKPISTKVIIAKKIFSLKKFKNQIFTCSALSFAKELNPTLEEIKKLGKIKYIDACVMKDWKKYSIHIIEPVLKIIETYNIIQKTDTIKTTKIILNKNQKTVSFLWKSGLITTFSTLGKIKTPIIIRLFGTNGYKELIFKNTFDAFKNSLQKFINIILKKEKSINKKFVLKTIKMIELGNKYE
ncbi:Gfo/Idh/MocA family oxidoreductase [Candidatus Babeliales bacterium]|nr:Gfo/Idh/MocA family oxidoreductase [Candidatus Babeliales bacterium]